MSKRNREKRQKKVANIDVATRIHQMLRADYRCTEEEIHMIDQALKAMVPHQIAEKMMEWHGQPIEALPGGIKLLDDDGSVLETFSMTTHPVNRLYDYLEEHFTHRFATLYWAAITSPNDPTDYFNFLELIKKSSFMDDIDGNEAES